MWKWKTWNDQLSLFLIFLIPALWVVAAFYPVNEQAMGATILAWGYVLQYYFRKAPSNSNES